MVTPQPGGNGGGGGYVPQSQDVSWTDINGKPTTLSGYGITDAYWATTQSTSDKRNLTIGSVTQQVITAHQSLSGYATEYWVGQQGYATQSWVGQQGYLTSSALSGYATQTWVGQQGFATQTWVGNNYLPLTGGTVTGNIYIGNTTIYASGSNGGINSLAVADDCILGDCNIGGHLGLKSLNTNDAGISFYTMSGGGLGRLYTNGSFYFYNGSGGNATVNVGNLYSAGYVTALSDSRKKRVLGDIVLSAEQIAQMPSVRFEWKDPKKPGTFIGTLAQPWREILPEAVHTLDDGTLSFDYQSAAIVALINLADEIVSIKNKLNRYGFK
jgi:hypothetical protein